MIRTRGDRYLDRIRAELRTAFAEDHTPREVAGSFSVGTFVTMLPTLGVGVAVFFVLVYLSDRVSKLALFASVLVFNPAVKWGVYAGSFAVGVALLGPVEGVTLADVSLAAGPEILVRLLVGNLLLAAVATAGSYVVVHRLAVAYGQSEVADIVDEAVEESVETALEAD